MRIFMIALFCLTLVLPAQAYNKTPGKGVTVQPARATWNTGYFQEALVRQALEELGCKLKKTKELANPIFYQSLKLGDVDYWTNGWFPMHNGQLPKGFHEKAETIGYVAKAGGLRGLFDRSVEELQQESGIGLAKACQLKAVIELAIRTASSFEQQVSIKQPADVGRLLMPRFQLLKHEEFIALLLDSKNRLLREVGISEGSLTASIVHPREVFAPVVREAAAAVLFVHNHPSGDPAPSREDLEITRRLKEAGDLMGVRVLDHIIIGSEGYVSLADRGLL